MYYPIPGLPIIADLSAKEMKDDKVVVSGYAVRRDDESIVEEIGKVVGDPKNKKYKDLAINSAITKIVNAYNIYIGYQPPTQEDLVNTFANLRRDVLSDAMLVLYPRWKARATNENALTFFERNVLDLLKPFFGPNAKAFLPSDRDAIEGKLTETIAKRSRCSEESARENAQQRLRDADIIYSHLRERDSRFPDIRLAPAVPLKHQPKPEQVKYLPYNVLCKFYKIVKETAKTDPKFALFCVMVIFGLRPAEAAGRKPTDITWHDKFCTIKVDTQERGGILDPRMKNDYSPRVLIIPYWGKKILETCCREIGDDFPKDEHAMNIAVDCAARVKAILINECGAKEALLAAVNELTDDDFDTDDTKDRTGAMKDAKIGCYVLRRIFCSKCRSVMGLSLYETDRLLGHIPSQKGKKLVETDMNSLEAQALLAQKMERYIYDPEFSLNPAVEPVPLHPGEKQNLIPFTKIYLRNGTKKKLTKVLHLKAAEPGEPIRIFIPTGCKQNLKPESGSDSIDHNRLVIGNTDWNDDYLTNEKGV